MNALFTDKFTYIAVALFLTLSCKVDENARKGNQGGSSSLGSGKGSILPGGKPGSGFGGGPVSEIPVPTTPPISNTGSSLAAFFSNGGSLVPVPADCKKYLDRKPVTPVAIASLAAACEINQKILEGTLKEEPVAYIGVLSVAISKGRLISRIESPWFGDRIPGITSIIPNPDNIKFKGMGTASLAMIATEFGAGTAIHKIHGPLGYGWEVVSGVKNGVFRVSASTAGYTLDGKQKAWKFLGTVPKELQLPAVSEYPMVSLSLLGEGSLDYSSEPKIADKSVNQRNFSIAEISAHKAAAIINNADSTRDRVRPFTVPMIAITDSNRYRDGLADPRPASIAILGTSVFVAAPSGADDAARLISENSASFAQMYETGFIDIGLPTVVGTGTLGITPTIELAVELGRFNQKVQFRTALYDTYNEKDVNLLTNLTPGVDQPPFPALKTGMATIISFLPPKVLKENPLKPKPVKDAPNLALKINAQIYNRFIDWPSKLPTASNMNRDQFKTLCANLHADYVEVDMSEKYAALRAEVGLEYKFLMCEVPQSPRQIMSRALDYKNAHQYGVDQYPWLGQDACKTAMLDRGILVKKSAQYPGMSACILIGSFPGSAGTVFLYSATNPHDASDPTGFISSSNTSQETLHSTGTTTNALSP